jgi:hypothetical protein
MLSFFDSLTDPHIERSKLHSLKDIAGLTTCAVLSGCNDWQAIEIYGMCKEAWLKTFLALLNGIPSLDTLNRVFAVLNPKEVQAFFLSWVEHIVEITDGRVVSIDGKKTLQFRCRWKERLSAHS